MTFKSAQLFATMDQVLHDLTNDENNSPTGLSDRLREASASLQGKIGSFIPVVEIRSFRIDQHVHFGDWVSINPLLTVSSVKINDVESSEYSLEPRNRKWINGPYTGISFENTCLWPGDIIKISGEWGLYDAEIETEFSITLDNTLKTFSLSNGGYFSPGMVLHIDDEQMLIVSGNGSNGSPAPIDSEANLSVDIESNMIEQIIDVSDGTKFSENEVIRIGSENMLVEKISGNELTVRRGWNLSIISEHSADDDIYVYRSYQVERGVNGTEAGSHDDAAITVYVVPEDVNWLCRQITALMIKKASSGFTGIVGNSEIGQNTYLSEFPPSQIEFVRSNYRW